MNWEPLIIGDELGDRKTRNLQAELENTKNILSMLCYSILLLASVDIVFNLFF